MNNLKPGPEMDALVAKKVMSLTLTGEKSQYGERHKTKWPQGDIVHLSMDYAESLVPGYSTDIAAAWKVVERLNDSAEEVLLTKAYGKWCCHVKVKEDNLATAIADTAPMAICLAALSAVEK